MDVRFNEILCSPPNPSSSTAHFVGPSVELKNLITKTLWATTAMWAEITYNVYLAETMKNEGERRILSWYFPKSIK